MKERKVRNVRGYVIIKRALDFILSLTAVIVLAPVFLILGVIIKLDSRGPVLFKQKRIGKDKTYFNIYKFRTMRLDAPSDCPTHLLNDSEVYITRVGKFLRKTSLDELPQIYNILLGQMSIIGPRPALWNQYDLNEARDKYRANEIRPGLTGWAQIHGRDELQIAEKAESDGYYVMNMCFWMDVKCFFGTIIPVAARSGIVEGTKL